MCAVFVALQDIDEGMGPTVFLPKSNAKDAHTKLYTPSTKDVFLGATEYRQALLRKGDVVVMDTRTMHYGRSVHCTISYHSNLLLFTHIIHILYTSYHTYSANTSENRRVLLYFTLRTPLVYDPVLAKKGSKFASLHLTLSDLSLT